MTRAKNKAVAIHPFWVFRVVLEELVPERVGHGGGSHGHPGMSRIGILYGIRRQDANGVDAKIFQRLSF